MVTNRSGFLSIKKFSSDLITGPCFGVCLEQEFILLPIFVLFSIYFDLNIDQNEPDEQYAVLLSTTSLI